MKATFILHGVDCAVCASSLENAINKLDYIKKATLDFVNLKLYVETIDEINLTETKLKEKLQAITSKVLVNVTIQSANNVNYINFRRKKLGNAVENKEVPTVNHFHITQENIIDVVEKENLNNKQNTQTNSNKVAIKNKYKINFLSFSFIRIYINLFFFILGICLPINKYIKLPFYLIAFIVIGYDVVYNAIKNIIKGKLLDERFLMSLASIAAFGIGEWPEAVMVMLLYQIGELFSDSAVNKTRHEINEIINLKAESANLIINNEIKSVLPEELLIGDTILIKVGEKVPTDVKIISGESNFDVSSITGESMPAYYKTNDTVLSGSINLTNIVYAEVTSEFKDSTVSKILDLVENNGANKSKAENFITKFAKYYTPIVVLIAIVLFSCFPLYSNGVIEGIKKAAVFLVISCPCALVISVPLTYFCGLGISAKKGLLIKGANVLDNINNLKAICFDKTGTLTYGKFTISEVYSVNKNEKEMLELLRIAESTSNHPIANCIVEGHNINTKLIKSAKEILGKGIIVTLKNSNKIYCGNEKLLKSYNINFNEQILGGTIIYVAKNKEYLGYVVIVDEIKENAKEEIIKLNKSNIKTVMLTGDNNATANYVSYEVGVSETYSNLLPQDKVEKFNEIKEKYNHVGFVGDGVNDTPVLSSASVSYAMGINGSDSAIELSDVVIMTDNISAVNNSIKIAKSTRKIAIENIVFSLSVKLAIMILSIFGISNMYLAIFADVGVSILAVLNAVRIFKTKLK